MPIRTQLPQDREQVQQLAQAFLPFGQQFPDVILKIFDRNAIGLPAIINMAEVEVFVHTAADGTGDGFAAIEWKSSGQVLELHAIAVDAEHRSEGVGSALIDHLVSLAQARKGSGAIECITAETENPAALQFFTHAGFENLGFAGYYPAGQRAVRLRKRIG